MKKIVEKHPLAIRWFHWVNFPILAIMIWSGLLIYWANDVYTVGFGDKTILKFFPKSFYEALGIPFRLGEGMAYHFVFMWIFALNGLLYVLFTIFSGQWRYLLPGRSALGNSWKVVLADLGIRKTHPPQSKYNSAQQIAYTMVVVLGLGSLLTGIAIYKPVQFNWLCALMGGYESARIIHFILTIAYCLFFIVHILQVIRAGWRNFSSMVTGFEVIPEKRAP